MELLPDRIRNLLAVKGRLKQTELVGVGAGELGKWLCGDREPDLNDLKRLAQALNATSDYLIGLGDDFKGDAGLAAAKMSFAYFERDPTVSPDGKRDCRRVFGDDPVLARQGAPRTAEDWKVLAAMIERGRPSPANVEEAKTRGPANATSPGIGSGTDLTKPE